MRTQREERPPHAEVLGHLRPCLPNVRGPGAHKACIAVHLPSTEEVDASYRELSDKGVTFQTPPADYRWNAYIAPTSPAPTTRSGNSTPGAKAAPRGSSLT